MATQSKLDVFNEAIAVITLVGGGALVAANDAPILKILVVVIIVVGGVDQWFAWRKLGGDARNVGTRLLLLVGLTLISIGAFFQ